AGMKGMMAYGVALKADDTVWTWAGESRTARRLIGVEGVTAIGASGHGLALKSDGTVVTWGIYVSSSPVPVSGLTDVTAMAAGHRHSLALKRDGTVAAWGDVTRRSTSPVAVSGL